MKKPSKVRGEASERLQECLNKIEIWLKEWRIKANVTKSVHVTFTLKQENCPPVKLGNQLLTHHDSVKYLGMHLDRRLTWKKHLESKREQLKLSYKGLYWLLDQNSTLSVANKLLIYKTVLKPIWTYGIELWGSACTSNINIIQRLQNCILKTISNAPWFIRNTELYSTLKVGTVLEEIEKNIKKYKSKLERHPNILAVQLLTPKYRPRLKRKSILPHKEGTVPNEKDSSMEESLMDEQSTSTLDAEALNNGEADQDKNGHNKQLRRLDTVPDIKRDTSGITTQYIATGIVNLGAFAAGVCVAWSSSPLPIVRTEVTEESIHIAESWAASLLCLGAVFGAVPAGLISENFGRKKTLLYLALPLVISWILVASSPNPYGLYIGRFVGGVAVGAFSVGIPPYVEDIAEKELLPTLANFFHVQFSCGVLFGYIVGLVESRTWFCTLCAIIPTAFFVGFIFLPESPSYLMYQGKLDEAKAALRYFRGIDNDIDSEIKALREQLRNSVKTRVTFKELFATKPTLKALVVSFGLMIFQQLSGIYPILFFSREIFCNFHVTLGPPSVACIILGFCFVSSTYFATMLLKVVRRRVLLLVSFFAMAMSLGSLGVYYLLTITNESVYHIWIPILCLCLHVSVYAAGAGPIPWLMLREIFPQNVTRRATAITAGFHWFLAFGVTKLYKNLDDMVKPGWALWHLAVSCLVATLFVYFFVPETKDRSLQEIQDEFEGIHKKKKHRHVIEVESLSEA